MKLQFYGAAAEVTGSCHILEVGGKRVLLDCGMIQGRPKDEKRNAEPFPFDAKTIDAVVLSHAHLDHCGRLPLLVKRGFKGPIYAQNASLALADILLRDAAALAKYDAARKNRKRLRRGQSEIKPLYTPRQAQRVIKSMQGMRYRERQNILPGIDIRFQDAGHIMGSTSVELWLQEGEVSKKLVFSGDLGQYDTPILHDPAVIEDADLVIMESTYGGRRHRDRRMTYDELGELIKAKGAHGNIIIPSFAIGRSQELLYTLGKHHQEWGVGDWQIYLDSPMAIKASEVYWDFPHLYDDEATKLRRGIDEMPRFNNLHFCRTPAQSRAINKQRKGAIIIAGSGMCNGGRVLHHLKHNLWHKANSVIFVGYQAPGSLGRRLVDGAKKLKIHRESIRVKGSVHTVGGLSAHGDEQDLGRWYSGFKQTPPVCLVHGEVKAAKHLQQHLQSQFGAKVTLPKPGDQVDLAAL